MALKEHQITLIADDFGLGRGHDAVILSLLEEGHIHGTSVMVDGEIDRQAVDRLIELRFDGCQVGLHLNLTYSFQDNYPRLPVSRLLGSAMTGSLSPAFGADLIRQAELFQEIFGFVPDFYDGHQHCHCLPGLTQTVVELPRDKNTWLRVPLPRGFSGLWLNLRAGGAKVLLLSALAGWAGRKFRASGWPVNPNFSGYLDLSNPQKVENWLPKLMKQAKPGCLIMVHPGAMNDPVQTPGHHPQSRQVEDMVIRRMHQISSC